jgi:hypothetical protein
MSPSLREVAARTAFYLSLVKFVGSAPASVTPTKEAEHVALPEDRTLQAFSPLLNVQQDLDYKVACRVKSLIFLCRSNTQVEALPQTGFQGAFGAVCAV